MDLREIGWGGGVEWIQLAQDRDRWRAVVNAVMNLRVLAPRRLLVSQLVSGTFINKLFKNVHISQVFSTRRHIMVQSITLPGATINVRTET
jgi:hypothetical protein